MFQFWSLWLWEILLRTYLSNVCPRGFFVYVLWKILVLMMCDWKRKHVSFLWSSFIKELFILLLPLPMRIWCLWKGERSERSYSNQGNSFFLLSIARESLKSHRLSLILVWLNFKTNKTLSARAQEKSFNMWIEPKKRKQRNKRTASIVLLFTVLSFTYWTTFWEHYM